MDDYKLEIKRINNGYILKGKLSDDEFEIEKVIQESNLVDNELNAMRSLLFEVKEYFGIYYNKHNKKNIEIYIVENN